MLLEIENNVVSRLIYRGENLILPWGVETADSTSFFSLEKNRGWRYRVLGERYHFTDTEYKAEVTPAMREGRWRLRLEDRVEGDDRVLRSLEVDFLEDSYIMDFVMRFRFRRDLFPSAEIAGRTLFHNSTNLYYQYPVDRALLRGGRFSVLVSMLEHGCPESLRPFMYVRDAEGEWVVHIRFLPESWDREVIKLCNRWAGTRPLPSAVSRVLLRSEAVRKKLWYGSERGRYSSFLLRRINPNAYPLALMNKGSRISLRAEMRIIEGD